MIDRRKGHRDEARTLRTLFTRQDSVGSEKRSKPQRFPWKIQPFQIPAALPAARPVGTCTMNPHGMSDSHPSSLLSLELLLHGKPCTRTDYCRADRACAVSWDPSTAQGSHGPSRNTQMLFHLLYLPSPSVSQGLQGCVGFATLIPAHSGSPWMVFYSIAAWHA